MNAFAARSALVVAALTGVSGAAAAEIPGTASAPPPAASSDAETLAEMERALAADEAASASHNSSGSAAEGGPPPPLFQSLNPDLSFITDVALAGFSRRDPPMMGGHDPNKNGFNLQQLEMAIRSMVDPYFRFDGYIVLSQYGIEIEEVYATTLALPGRFQARVGQFLTRFGRINATHPHTWAFVDQTLVLGKFFGGEGNRGLGAEASWLAPLPWYLELVASATEAAGASTARSFFGAEDLGVRTPADLQYTLAAKQFHPLSDNWSLSWGLSGALGPNPTGRGNRTDIYGADLFLKYRPITYGSYTQVSLEIEGLVRRRQLPERLLQDHGLYAYLVWRFAQRWAVAARYEAVTGVAADPLDPEWTRTRRRTSANVTFWPTEFSRLRLQYSYDRPGGQPGWHALFLALEFAVGEHGAHAF